MKTIFKSLLAITVLSLVLSSCGNGGSKKGSQGALSSSAAEKVYVAPGEHDEFYAFVSGGFSGQLAVYGLPSGRLFKVIPVFSVDAEKAYGFNEETKPMLNTSHGFIPWDDDIDIGFKTDENYEEVKNLIEVKDYSGAYQNQNPKNNFNESSSDFEQHNDFFENNNLNFGMGQPPGVQCAQQ